MTGPTLYAYVFRRPVKHVKGTPVVPGTKTPIYVIYAHSEKCARQVFASDFEGLLPEDYVPELLRREPW